jgi:hypothetical protein
MLSPPEMGVVKQLIDVQAEAPAVSRIAVSEEGVEVPTVGAERQGPAKGRNPFILTCNGAAVVLRAIVQKHDVFGAQGQMMLNKGLDELLPVLDSADHDYLVGDRPIYRPSERR